jgi:hypothetical protein
MEEAKNKSKGLEFDTSLLLDLPFNECLGDVPQELKGKAASTRSSLFRFRPSFWITDRIQKIVPGWVQTAKSDTEVSLATIDISRFENLCEMVVDLVGIVTRHSDLLRDGSNDHHSSRPHGKCFQPEKQFPNQIHLSLHLIPS